MRWKLSKGNSREKELPISDKTSMSYESNQKNGNVFTITQLTPTELTGIVTDCSSYQNYKARSNGDSIFDQSAKINHSTSLQTSSSPLPATTKELTHHHRDCNRIRRLSFEEALKFCHPDSGDNNDGGNNFVINSSNQKEKSTSWANSHQHKHYPHHSHLHHSQTTTTIATTPSPPPPSAITVSDHLPSSIADLRNHHHHHAVKQHHVNDRLENKNDSNPMNATILDNGYNDGESNGNFHYVNSTATTTTTTHPSSNGSLSNTKNGSTTKLLPSSSASDSQLTTQSKCSYFGGLVLCLCLNVTYTNIIRFPRELDQYGTAYLIPYFIMLFLVGLPIILLEVSIGQFLGQGAANSWRSSPIFKGASVVGRLASGLTTIWISMQASLAISYIGMLIFKSVPFSECASGVKIIAQAGYKENGKCGQDCIQRTFLAPIWVNAQYFGFLTLGLVILWIIMLGCTYNAKVFRRLSFFIGTVGFALLVLLTGWEVYKSLGMQYFPELWGFNKTALTNSNIWFSALVQVIYSTNIGFGVIPVISGKFLHKSDATRTTVLYFCFNLLIITVSVILFMVQFDNIVTRNSDTPLKELKPLTAVYDKVLNESDLITTRVILGIIYSLFVISAVMSISMAIYTSSRLIPRHPTYVLNLLGLIAAVMALIGPKYIIARVLDSRIVGTLVIVTLVFELIATMWVYGAKNIRTDLEFSIGRTIYILWLILWCIAPVILAATLIWWCVEDDQFDSLRNFIPKWAPIVFVVAIILVIACVEIFKQVDYNFFGMICEAAKPAKEWGPADPLARHAWKQWRSVCQDTGRKDFTLRRRGTRDYTHSIKRGQYSTATKYGTQNWKSSTPGNSSPNYSGSVFGDSAIEEDMSVDKYSGGVDSQFTAFSSDNHGIKPVRYSNRSRRISHERQRNNSIISGDKHKEIVYIRRLSNERANATKIEITPANENIVYATRNPVPSSTLIVQSNRLSNNSQRGGTTEGKIGVVGDSQTTGNPDHICWRKFSVNSEEYSTEL